MKLSKGRSATVRICQDELSAAAVAVLAGALYRTPADRALAFAEYLGLCARLAFGSAGGPVGDLGAVIPAFQGTQTAFAKSMPGVDLQVFLDEVDQG